MVAPPLASLSVRELTKRYGTLEAVRGVSFAVAAGEIFGLLGPNGAGKTTIIESILGLRQPDSGSIFLHGVDALANPVQTRRAVGAQLQFAALQDKITPRQALKCFAAFYANSTSAETLLAQFSLTDKADAAFDSLSGGQKQRLFLALALVNQPGLLILDEPTAGLDPQSRRELHDLIRELKSGGRSVLLSTHSLDEAHQLCDRIGILLTGRLIATGTPRELIARSATKPRLSFRAAQPLDSVVVAALPGVTAQQLYQGAWTINSADVNQTLLALVQTVAASGNELIDLQIHRPTLEDVFLEITGRNSTDTQPADPMHD